MRSTSSGDKDSEIKIFWMSRFKEGRKKCSSDQRHQRAISAKQSKEHSRTSPGTIQSVCID